MCADHHGEEPGGGQEGGPPPHLPGGVVPLQAPRGRLAHGKGSRRGPTLPTRSRFHAGLGAEMGLDPRLGGGSD